MNCVCTGMCRRRRSAFAAPAEASLNDCIDATCRITGPEKTLPDGQRGNDRGSGCAFHRVQGAVWVLTNAHVVTDATAVHCEFWQQGHQSSPLPGRVIARDAEIDAAIVEVPESAFGGRLPAIIPLAEAAQCPRPDETVTSVGCANGAWATGWKGHVLGYRGADLIFLPPPANGRSGSAVFNADGTKIVGLVRARNDAAGHGIATGLIVLRNQMVATSDRGGTSSLALQQSAIAAAGPQVATAANVSECGPGGCGPGGCGPGGCEVPKYRLLPYRQRQGYESSAPPRAENPWPTLPAPAATTPDLSPLEQQLGRITNLLEDLRQGTKAAPAPLPAAAPAPAPDPTAGQALGLAQQTAEALLLTKKKVDELESTSVAVKANQERLAGQVKAVADNHEKLAEMVAKHGTLSERFEARKAEVDAKLGEHAGKLEKVHEFAKSLIEDKVAALKDGHGDTRLILLIVVLAVVAVFVVGVVKDVLNHNSTGQPLAVEKIAAQLATQATAQPWLTPAANLASRAAQDVTTIVDQIDQRILAHKQADAIAKVTAAATPVPAAPAAAAPKAAPAPAATT